MSVPAPPARIFLVLDIFFFSGNGSDVFGSDICTCKPYLVYAIEECIRGAQKGILTDIRSLFNPSTLFISKVASASSSTFERKVVHSAK